MTAPNDPVAGLALVRAVMGEAAASGQAPAHLADLEVHAGTRLDELGLDSLGMAHLAQRLGARAGAELPLEELLALDTLGDLAETLQRARRPAGARFLERGRRFRELRERGLYPYHTPLAELRGSHVETSDGERMLMLSSYSYLGLNGDPRVLDAVQAACARYGQGTHGVRPVAGSLDLHLRLEAALAAFTGSEDALVFPNGFGTNVAVVSALAGPGDVVAVDEFAHASLHDGCRLSGADVRVFPHESLADLRAILEEARDRHVLVCVDAVYSMEGDVADLPALSRLCRRHGAMLMVDEAHSLGVLGARGGGILEHFGLPADAVDVKMGTMSKALSSTGGFVAGERDLVDHLRHHARGHVFSGALPAPQAAAALAALEILQAEPERVACLRENAAFWREGLAAWGFRLTRTSTPIVPILMDSEQEAFETAMRLRRRGLFIIPIVYPAVPVNAPRLRTTVTASHTRAELETALAAMEADRTASQRSIGTSSPGGSTW